jgi:orotidine-5'-phosphate decarboxylase
VRQIVDDLPILVPGVGAQGGSADEVKANGSRADGHGIIVNSSRAVLFASSGDDFASAARVVADDTRKSCSP